MSAGMQKALAERCSAVGLGGPGRLAEGSYKMAWEDLERALLELAACWVQYGASTTDAQAVRDAVKMVNQTWTCTCPQHTGSCEFHRPAYFRQHEDVLFMGTKAEAAEEISALAATEVPGNVIPFRGASDGPSPSN